MKIMVIPDCQVKPGNSIEHLRWAGLYAADKKPDVIVNIGDFWDMPSLSSYDVGKKSFEGRRYQKDIEAGNAAMDVFMQPILDEQERLRRNKKTIWKPRLVFTLGNHEHRIERAVNDDPKLEGLLSYNDFNLTDHDWEVYGFLQPVVIEGIVFSHYFTSGVMGRPVTNAKLLLQKKHMSCIQGHVQEWDIHHERRADGQPMTAIFAGIFYDHDEEYLTPQTNGSWSGIWMLHEVNDGSFDHMMVSLNYLRKKYGDNFGSIRLVS